MLGFAKVLTTPKIQTKAFINEFINLQKQNCPKTHVLKIYTEIKSIAYLVS